MERWIWIHRPSACDQSVILCVSITIHDAPNLDKQLLFSQKQVLILKIIAIFQKAFIQTISRYCLHLPGIIRPKDVVGDVDVKSLDSNGIQTLLKEQPKCLERPVLVMNGQAVVGRPPERILEFLQSQ